MIPMIGRPQIVVTQRSPPSGISFTVRLSRPRARIQQSDPNAVEKAQRWCVRFKHKHPCFVRTLVFAEGNQSGNEHHHPGTPEKRRRNHYARSSYSDEPPTQFPGILTAAFDTMSAVAGGTTQLVGSLLGRSLRRETRVSERQPSVCSVCLCVHVANATPHAFAL